MYEQRVIPGATKQEVDDILSLLEVVAEAAGDAKEGVSITHAAIVGLARNAVFRVAHGGKEKEEGRAERILESLTQDQRNALLAIMLEGLQPGIDVQKFIPSIEDQDVLTLQSNMVDAVMQDGFHAHGYTNVRKMAESVVAFMIDRLLKGHIDRPNLTRMGQEIGVSTYYIEKVCYSVSNSFDKNRFSYRGKKIEYCCNYFRFVEETPEA